MAHEEFKVREGEPFAGEFGHALLPVCRALSTLGVEYYLSGSLASSLHGVVRATADADLVAEMSFESAVQLIENLKESYYGDVLAAKEAVLRGGSFNVIHNDTMIKIDVFVPSNDPFSQSALRRAELLPPGIHVARADDVLLSKLRWFEQGGRISERQWTDVLGLLRVASDRMDVAYLNTMAEQMGVHQLLAKARSEA